MKSIDTLVEDIYNLFNDIENDIDDTVIEEFGDNIKTHLKAALLDNTDF